MPLVAEFCARYPQIQLELNTDDIVIDLLEQQTDIAIRIGELRDSTLRARVLAAARFACWPVRPIWKKPARHRA